jgi:hypothetical protein
MFSAIPIRTETSAEKSSPFLESRTQGQAAGQFKLQPVPHYTSTARFLPLILLQQRFTCSKTWNKNSPGYVYF